MNDRSSVKRPTREAWRVIRRPTPSHSRVALLFVLILGSIVGLNLCCHEQARTPTPPDESTIVDSILLAPEGPPKPTCALWRVYLDCSESMRGFAARHKSFDDIINDLDLQLAGPVKGNAAVEYYSFSRGAIDQRDRDWFSRAGFDAGRYAGAETDIGAVLLHIVEQPSQPPEVAMVITDGVQSTREVENNAPLVKEITKWLAWGYDCGIVAVKVPFAGPAFSEMLGDARISSYHTCTRPIYVVILTSKRTAYNNLRTLIASGISKEAKRDAQALLLPGGLMVPQNVSVRGPFGKGVFRGGQRSKRYPLCHLLWTGDPEITGPGAIRIMCQVKLDEYAVMDGSFPRRERIDTACAVRATAHRLGTDTVIVDRRQRLVASTRSACRVNLKTRVLRAMIALPGRRDTLRRNIDAAVEFDGIDQPGTYLVRADVTYRRDIIKVPDWVNAYSTDDDSDVDHYGRTYNFDRLIHALVSWTSLGELKVGTFFVEFYKPEPKTKR